MRLSHTIFLLSALFSTMTHASIISRGKSLPDVSVLKYGQLILKNDKISYMPWQSHEMLNKTRIVQAMAGRTSAKALNESLIEAIKQANFNETKYQTTTIVNQDDALWGTGLFVKSALSENKRTYPTSSFVLDANGVVASKWQLQPKSAAVIVIDKKGIVQFFKQGALTPTEIKQVIQLVHRLTK